MSSSSSQPKPPLSLRQELLGRPSASLLAVAVLGAAVCHVEAAPPAASPTPAPTGTPPQDTIPDASLKGIDRVIIEGTSDSYKPEHALSAKRPESLLNTPQSISVVPREVIRDQNDTDLRGILRNVPGITVQAGEGGASPGDNFIIRGFSARTDLYVDGVRDINGFYRDPFNIEQVEVTKGPASVYSGRGSTGGSINVITKTPQLRPFYEVEAGVGTEGYDRDSIDFNQPISFGGNHHDPKDGSDTPPTAAVRLNAVWHTNDVPGREEAAYQRWGVAPSVAFGLGTPTQLTISYLHLDQNNMPDFGVPWVTAANIPLATLRNQPAPVNYSNYYGLNQRDFEFLRTDEILSILSHDFGDFANLRYTFHAGRNYRDSVISAPRFISNASTDINREFQSRDEVSNVLTSELDLTLHFKTFGLEHTLLTGFEYTRQTDHNYLRASPVVPLANLYHPDPNAPVTGDAYRTGGLTYGETDTIAGYVFDTIKIGKQWQVSGGVRIDDFNADYTALPARGSTTPTLNLGREDTPVSWRAALLYKPVEFGSFYFGAGTSFNPSAEDLALTTATQNIAPEKTVAYEIGTKWDLFQQRLSLNGALFWTTKDNARTPGLIAGGPVTVLDGEQRARGFDFEAKGKLTQDWEVIGGYTYTDSEIVKSNTPAEVGSRLPGVPEHSFTLWTVYHFPLGFEAGFGTQYVSHRYANLINTRLADGYYMFDAMAAYHVNKHLTLRVNVYNFTDEQYIGALHIQGSYGHFFPGQRRSAIFTASYLF